MNESFELLSSMSPKINKMQKPLTRPPTKLALKKYFRKSMDVPHTSQSMKRDSVILIDSSSSCSSDSENVLNETPIEISDSETSLIDKTPRKKVNYDNIKTPGQNDRRLSKEKFKNIEQWVDEVNSAKNDTQFSDVSTVLGDYGSGFKQRSKVATSSTLLESDVKRFDELFKKDKKKMSDSSEDEDLEVDFKNMTLDDSLLDKNESLRTRIKKQEKLSDKNNSSRKDLEIDFKNITLDDSLLDKDESPRFKKQEKLPDRNYSSRKNTVCDTRDYENLLDSLYGDSWREKKEEILPQSEPRLTKPKPKNKQICNTERRGRVLNEKRENNLLKDLQKERFKKALESPWMKTIKNVCDSDTDSDNENKLPKIKLFEDDSSDDDEIVQKVVNKKTQENTTKTYSFLASLSANVPSAKCDITALIYRNDFKQHKEKLAKKLFDLFNEKVFDKSIPKNTEIQWNDRLRGTAGYCKCRKITRRTGAVERMVTIVLATKVLDSADRLRDTLIHELCHAATWIVNQVSDGHGAFWKAWACRAMKTFPELPKIKRCHEYVINTKYTYKCTGCGYSIGRHTKSLDVERKRCGYCYGKFDVLINKTTKNGETKSVPATPKKPSGFALFVKENYATFKTPELTHGGVMKVLGQKFAQLKVDQS